MSKAIAATERYSLTVPEAAKRVGLSADTLHRHIRAGKLKARKSAETGGKTLVRVDALDAWFDGLPEA
jgi:excisionase family DNA binding protein